MTNRWARLLQVGITAVLLASCDGSASREYEIGGATYAIPQEHIVTSRDDPALFIRVSPPGKSFNLVYDTETSQRIDALGEPFVFSVSGAPLEALRYMHFPEAVVVCRTGSNPVGSCGTSIRVNGANWTVLIPPASLNEVGMIVRDARATLASYRVQ